MSKRDPYAPALVLVPRYLFGYLDSSQEKTSVR